MHTVLVVDDEKKIVEVVQSYLERAGYRVRCAYSGSEALAAFRAGMPSLIILDLMLPDVSGEDVCRTMRRSSDVPIIMLTAKVEEESVLRGLDIGADDYVTKPFSPRQLVARVAAVLRRVPEGHDQPVVVSFNQGSLVIDGERFIVLRRGAPVQLTPNEFKLVSAMARYPAKVFTRDELIAAALGSDFDGYDRVIDSHIKNIRQKIEDDPRSPVYIQTVHGVGYRFGGTADENV